MHWFLTIIVTIFLFNNLSEAKLEKKLPSAVIVGTVYCETCFQAELSKPTHFIAGALVGVECEGTRSNPGFQKQVKTNTNGEFRVHLPFSISKHVNKIKNCSVKLIKSNEPYCAIASSATQSSLHLKTKNTKTHIFSAGYFTFKPQNQPNLCNQKPSKNFNSGKFLNLIDPTPIVQNPIIPNLPSQNPVISNLPPQNPIIPNLPPTGPTLLPLLPTPPRLPPLPLFPPLPALPGLLLYPPTTKKMKLKTENALKKTKLPNDEVTKNKNVLDKKEFPNYEVVKTNNALGKRELPNYEEPKTKNALGKTELPNYELPKTKNAFLKMELSNFGMGKYQVLPQNPQVPIFSSPPPVFGFYFPPFSFRQPSTNFPTNPFQPSQPSANFPTIPNFNSPPVIQQPPVLTNPNLPPFPFQPSPGLPGHPPATEKKSP